MYEAGRTVKDDKARALELYRTGCDTGNRYACQDVERFEEVMRGRPSERGGEDIDTTVLGATLGSTTIEQLEALHSSSERELELGCSGGLIYSIANQSAGQLWMVWFFFDDTGVLAGTTMWTDVNRMDESAPSSTGSTRPRRHPRRSPSARILCGDTGTRRSSSTRLPR